MGETPVQRVQKKDSKIDVKNGFTKSGESPVTREELVAHVASIFGVNEEYILVEGNTEQGKGAVVYVDNIPVCYIANAATILDEETFEYGAYPAIEKAEITSAYPFTDEESRENAQHLHDLLQQGGYEAVVQEGFGTIGFEDESFWIYVDEEGNICPLPLPKEAQIELQENLLETKTGVHTNPINAYLEWAQNKIQEIEDVEERNGLRMTASFMLFNNPLLLKTNSGENENYVNAIQYKMKGGFDYENFDAISMQYWLRIARKYGFKSIQELFEAQDTVGIISFAAAHKNHGASSYKVEIGSKEVVVSDILQMVYESDLHGSPIGLISDFFTNSGVIAYSVRAEAIFDGTGNLVNLNDREFDKDGNVILLDTDKKIPLDDSRQILRRISPTTTNRKRLESVNGYHTILGEGIIGGNIDRIDRAKGAHAQNRLRFLRIHKDENGNICFEKIATRLETVSSSACLCLVANATQTGAQRVLRIASNFALKEGEHPNNFYTADLDPNLKVYIDDPQNAIEIENLLLTRQYDHPVVQALINLNKDIVNLVRDTYSHESIKYDCDLAELGYKMKYEETVPEDIRTLSAYRFCYHGDVSIVLRRMVEDGMSEEEIAIEMHLFEKLQAEDILAYSGDILTMVQNKREIYNMTVSFEETQNNSQPIEP